jgi:hypothetical protein
MDLPPGGSYRKGNSYSFDFDASDSPPPEQPKKQPRRYVTLEEKEARALRIRLIVTASVASAIGLVAGVLIGRFLLP